MSGRTKVMVGVVVLEMVRLLVCWCCLGGINNKMGNKVVSIGVSPLLFVVRSGWVIAYFLRVCGICLGDLFVCMPVGLMLCVVCLWALVCRALMVWG